MQAELDLEELQAIDSPLGYGRDECRTENGTRIAMGYRHPRGSGGPGVLLARNRWQPTRRWLPLDSLSRE